MGTVGRERNFDAAHGWTFYFNGIGYGQRGHRVLLLSSQDDNILFSYKGVPSPPQSAPHIRLAVATEFRAGYSGMYAEACSGLCISETATRSRCKRTTTSLWQSFVARKAEISPFTFNNSAF